MKIAFTYNLKSSDDEAEAEFDTPETIDALSSTLEGLGHEVHLVEVSGPASRLVARLESLRPDLIFNTAEGTHGRYREAFYPALFEQLRVPFTGSDAYTCAVTLDKQATKLMARDAGVETPRWAFVDKDRPAEVSDLRFPLMVKPNFEGSSKGITQDSIVRSPQALEAQLDAMLARYPGGVLVEEFIVGRDVTVPYLELGPAETHGVLEPAAYRFETVGVEAGFVIYDYALKNEDCNSVFVDVPADVDAEVRAKLMAATRRLVEVLGIRDMGRADFRVTDSGEIFFIEVNALPSLEPGASIYESAALAGIDGVSAVLSKILDSAIGRWDIAPRPRRGDGLVVGLTHNVKRIDPRSGNDADAEFDAPKTIAAIAAAIESQGHEVVLLEAAPELPGILSAMELDLVFNIAEGLRGRNREAQIPALMELLDIEYTGSDAAALAITLDKGLAKRIVRASGVPTPASALLGPGMAKPEALRFPLIVKPNAEGSSKGITSASVVRDEDGLRAAVEDLWARYGSRALVETYLPGREFTVAVLGELEPRALPPMEIVFAPEAGPNPVYTFEHKLDFGDEVSFVVPANVEAALGAAIAAVACESFAALGCRDVARVDIRLDADGVPNFIECNPLPGLTPDFSDLCLIARAAGMDYKSLIGEIMTPAVRRLRAKRVKS